jgi:post-segregation antitoxin (ccd killing protein)
MKFERTTITLPIGLRDRAHARGINISALAADAVLRYIRKSDKIKETGVAPSKATSPATAPMSGRASDCQLQKC